MRKLRKLTILLASSLLMMVVFALPALAQDGTEVVGNPLFDLAWVGAVIGFFLPLVISFVKRSQWSTGAKQATALVVSAIAGVVNVGVQAKWQFDSAAQFLQLAAFSITDVWVTATVIYNNFWDGKTIDRTLASVGSA